LWRVVVFPELVGKTFREIGERSGRLPQFLVFVLQFSVFVLELIHGLIAIGQRALFFIVLMFPGAPFPCRTRNGGAANLLPVCGE
jgi:hypothetical protein